MNLTVASGTCNECGRFDKAIGADNDDATLMLHHSHQHPWKGQITFQTVDAETYFKKEKEKKR